MILSDALISTVSQLQIQQVMTPGEVTHRIFYTDLLYSCSLLDIDEKYGHNGGFKCDIIMVSDSGLLFWATLYIHKRFAIHRIWHFKGFLD